MKALSFIGIMLLALGAQAAPKFKIGVRLPSGEPYGVGLFHDGAYYAGVARQAEGESNRVEIFDKNLEKKLATINLKHTVMFIKEFSAHEVIVIGHTFAPSSQAFYTVIKKTGDQYTWKTTGLPTSVIPEFFGGTPGEMYFNEMGDRSVFKLVLGNPIMLMPEISGPGKLELIGKSLFVIERKAFEYGDENVVRIDTKTEKAERLFATDRNTITEITHWKGGNLLAVAETGASLVHFANPETGKIVSDRKIPTPRSFAELGKCLVVSSEESKLLTFLKMQDGSPQVVANLDLSSAGDQLFNTRLVSTDQATGRIYVRAVGPCPSCQVSRNVVATVEPEKAEDLAVCFN